MPLNIITHSFSSIKGKHAHFGSKTEKCCCFCGVPSCRTFLQPPKPNVSAVCLASPPIRSAEARRGEPRQRLAVSVSPPLVRHRLICVNKEEEGENTSRCSLPDPRPDPRVFSPAEELIMDILIIYPGPASAPPAKHLWCHNSENPSVSLWQFAGCPLNTVLVAPQSHSRLHVSSEKSKHPSPGPK